MEHDVWHYNYKFIRINTKGDDRFKVCSSSVSPYKESHIANVKVRHCLDFV